MPSPPRQIGRYHVHHRLGGGGMGIVYLAHDPVIDRRVAIKVLRTVIDDGDLRERFAREARSTGSLLHGNIVTVFDAGEYDGQPFLAMEFVDGRTIAEVVERRQPLPLAVRLRLIEDLCYGLAYAHARGIVHRDIKPANLIVARSGALKILDFGIARVVDAGVSRVTAVGSPSYMSPEQVLGGRVDHRADIFAVGLVLYELIAYQRAFPGDTLPRVAHAIAFEHPIDLATHVPGVDPRLVAIVDRAIAKQVERRYQDVNALREEVAGVRSSMPDPGNVAALVFGDSDEPAVRAVPATPRRRTDPAPLLARRAQRVADACELGEARLAGGDVEGAIAAAEEALVFDPDAPRPLSLLERARTLNEERQTDELLERAGRELDLGAITDAANLIEQAGQLVSGHERVAQARERVEALRREREEAARRRNETEAALGRSRLALTRFDYVTALEAAEAALALDPFSREADRLIVRARAGLEEERAEARRRAQVAALLNEGQVALQRDDFEAAMRAGRAVLSIDEGSVEASWLTARAEAGLETRRNAARRRDARDRALAAATIAIRREHFDAAIQAADAALAADPDSVEASALRQQARTALDARLEAEQWRAAMAGQLTAPTVVQAPVRPADEKGENETELPTTQIVVPRGNVEAIDIAAPLTCVMEPPAPTGGFDPSSAIQGSVGIERTASATRTPTLRAGQSSLRLAALALGVLVLMAAGWYLAPHVWAPRVPSSPGAGGGVDPRQGEIARLQTRARVALSSGQFEEAVRLFDAVLELDPTHVAARDDRSLALRKAEALSLTQQAEQHLAAGRVTEAIAAFERALAADAGRDDARRGLEQARARLTTPPPPTPGPSEAPEVAALVRAGERFRRAREYESAIARFEEARRLDPSSRAARDGLAEAREAKARADRALAALVEGGSGSATLPETPSPASRAEALFQQGLKAMNNGDFAAARRAFEEALRIDPAHARARTLLKTLTGS